MDAAKFCGNCGTPFPRSPVPSSSLVNCPQGHIYSAVYEHCPYCPQPEQTKSGDFATRVEGSETIVETASLSTPQQPMAAPAEFATRIETPLAAMTVIESGLAVVEEAANGSDDPPPTSEPRRASTDLIETVINQPTPVDTPVPPPLRAVRPTPEAPPPPPPPRPIREPHTADQPDRRTLVVSSLADDSPSKGKGKIVGWLISYTRHQEGVDYKLRTGFNRIGAHPACDLVMEDETVSSSHAVIVNRDGRCLIKDELSRNGTFVNGVEVTEARVLQNYDEVRVGNTVLTFILAEKPSS